MANYVFGIDVGGTSVKCGLFQTDGTLLEKWEIPTRTENGGSERDSTVLTLPEFIYSTYNSLLESGWRMDEIDRMDMPGFLKMRAWNARQEQKKKEPRQRYIDEVWSSLKPGGL